MLKGISPLISPELLRILSEMGHGDEIVLADAHFPGHSVGQRVIRADGVPMVPLLEGDDVNPVIWKTYRRVLEKAEPEAEPSWLERFAYYERAKQACCVVVTGETAQYANIILKKGVVCG